jgi:hypothetical protein
MNCKLSRCIGLHSILVIHKAHEQNRLRLLDVDEITLTIGLDKR